MPSSNRFKKNMKKETRPSHSLMYRRTWRQLEKNRILEERFSHCKKPLVHKLASAVKSRNKIRDIFEYLEDAMRRGWDHMGEVVAKEIQCIS